MTNEFKIIRAKLEHSETAALLFNAYRQSYEQSPDVAGAREFVSERLRQDQSVIFLALHDGNGCGFTQHYPAFSSRAMRPIWILNDLFVAPEARRLGVGKSLLQAANVVPTWNYVVVHVYGTFRLDDSRSRRWEVVRRYVDFYESTLDPPWSIDDADDDFIGHLLDAIVAFRITIERIEGKWKLNQNHDPQRRTKVIRALREAGSENRERVAGLMLDTMEKRTR